MTSAHDTTKSKKEATLYRMVTDEHVCPYGLKSLDLLERKGFTVEDHHLTSRSQTDSFKKKHGVKTTPQTFIGGVRIGGYDSLREHFGLETAQGDGITYKPVIAVFSVTALMAIAASWAVHGTPITIRTAELFVAFSMCVLAILKLQDLESFSSQFLGYDILARRVVRYSYFYPFAEAYAGLGMIAGAPAWLVTPVSLFIGTIGAISVFKAVYVEKRELKCACVGGNSNVPLGFISLTENLMMMAVGVWMFIR